MYRQIWQKYVFSFAIFFVFLCLFGTDSKNANSQEFMWISEELFDGINCRLQWGSTFMLTIFIVCFHFPSQDLLIVCSSSPISLLLTKISSEIRWRWPWILGNQNILHIFILPTSIFVFTNEFSNVGFSSSFWEIQLLKVPFQWCFCLNILSILTDKNIRYFFPYPNSHSSFLKAPLLVAATPDILHLQFLLFW